MTLTFQGHVMSRDHSIRHRPFPVGCPFGTERLSPAIFEIFCCKHWG